MKPIHQNEVIQFKTCNLKDRQSEKCPLTSSANGDEEKRANYGREHLTQGTDNQQGLTLY